MKTSGISDPGGVPQTAIQGPELLNILINDWDNGADCTLSKNICRMRQIWKEWLTNLRCVCLDVGRDLDGLEKQTL